MDVKKELARRAEIVNAALDKLLPDARAYPPVIHEAMRYSVFAGGKRLRPVLVLASAEAVRGSAEAVLPAACAIEILHTYSLIHDDLPAMDDDDLRRGKPTCHKVYGEAVAILAGDALLTTAFAILAGLPQSGRVTPERALQVTAEVAAAAGTNGLIGGQVVDLISSAADIDAQVLQYIHTHKTGALYRAAVRTGAILSGAGAEQLQALTLYAENLGLAFQIVDDILDVAGDERMLGKPVGSDAKNKKATYPALYGMAAAREKARQAGEGALAALQGFGDEAAFLRELVNFVLTREH